MVVMKYHVQVCELSNNNKEYDIFWIKYALNFQLKNSVNLQVDFTKRKQIFLYYQYFIKNFIQKFLKPFGIHL